MKKILFYFPPQEILAQSLSKDLGIPLGKLNLRSFPDGESYLRVESDCKGQDVILLGDLHHPDGKILYLIFLSETLKELGARRVGLVAPYLAYMRQDRRFQEGEALTSRLFAQLLSRSVDWLLTIDPHLHRYRSLSEIYSIPNQMCSAAPLISEWIQKNIPQALLIGPDNESEQWVAEVAQKAGAPYVILEKKRRGDREVEVSLPQVQSWKNYTPVLVDDIISSGRTMIETIRHLKQLDLPPPECIGVHAVFSEEDFQALLSAGAKRVTTTNTIPHPSNGIEVSNLLATALREWNFLKQEGVEKCV